MNLPLEKKDRLSLLERLRDNLDFEHAILKNFINLDIKEMEMVLRWRNNKSVRKWMYQSHIISPDEHIHFIDKLKEDNKNFYWLVKNNVGEYMGVISLNRVDFSNKNAYLGVYSNSDCKKSGAGSLLIGCLKELVFEKLNFHSLKLEVIANNEQAVTFYKKLGFSEEGKLKEFVFKDSKWHDMIVMGIVSSKVLT